MEELIVKYALQNAIKFNGKANAKAVIGKILAENPELKNPEFFKKVNEVIRKVNGMKIEEQREKLGEMAPELLERRKGEKKELFKDLKIRGKVITAFPPEPNKYLHIGHAKALLLNYELAKKHKGKFLLRFDDTNPTTVKKEFYNIILDDIKWLKVKPDRTDYGVEYMKKFYEYAEKLIREGKAYVCRCKLEKIRRDRAEKKECECRENKAEENMKLWKKMPGMREGEAVLRLKIDMKHKNTTMRDPTVMRIIREKHPRTRKRYNVWPTYDFETTVMDGIEKVNYRFRSKEFELRNELQNWIQKNLGLNETKWMFIARFNLEGVESSGRVLREKIRKKELLGWDDPSLTTLIALKRRGFVAEAIRNFVLSTGISKAESKLTWDDLIVQNKRILDKQANRYFLIKEPVKLTVKNAPDVKAELKLHPDFPKRGNRKIKLNRKGEDLIFYVEKKDLEKKKIRLMNLFNAEIVKKGAAEFKSKKLEKGYEKIHWLPYKENRKVKVLTPEKKILKCIAEKDVERIKKDEIVQFVRFGFCRCDKKGFFYFSHK